MNKKLLIISGTLIALMLFVIFGVLVPSGMFKTIQPHYQGQVTKATLPVAGPEDITIASHGIAFISSDDRRNNLKETDLIPGAILMMNLQDTTYTLRNVTPPQLTDFHPHGISLWTNEAGEQFLFAVNHQQRYTRHTIERFQWRGDSLVHLETIQDSALMTSPNDVVAVGERTFYVTNDHGHGEKGLNRTLEEYLQRSIAYVNYFDGQEFRKVAGGIAYANGINRSRDESKIYVASTTGRKIIVYDRDPETGNLEVAQEVNVNTGVDNIEVDEAGALWVGCHPQMLKFVAHASDAAEVSPSQVIKLTPSGSGEFTVEEVYLNDGTLYSGSSVGAVYNNRLIIGSVFEKSILVGIQN
ncbi:MAG: SMP-30/gluconolactonase/LRE family protein [Cyclobacteriaceae bacterium]|nr:SMP-30/gluconolactonase/LRE family protein [Cyclobacteriaceae bacterium]